MLADLPTAPWFRRLLVSGLILGILLLTFTVLQPFIVPLIWGAILAYVAWPLHLRVLKMCGGRNSAASLISTILVTLIIVVPLVLADPDAASGRRSRPMRGSRTFWRPSRNCRRPFATCPMSAPRRRRS